MAGKGKADSYANFAAIKVVESAANTQTSAKFAFPFSIMDKMALVISRLEYWLSTPDKLDTTGDYVYLALTAAATITDISAQNDPLIIDNYLYLRRDLGTAATGIIFQQPTIKDFSDLPGGGLLVAPSPLYAMAQGSGCSAANVAWFKMFYTYIELASDEYWQLVESRRIISS